MPQWRCISGAFTPAHSFWRIHFDAFVLAHSLRCIRSGAFTPAHSPRRIHSGAFVLAHSLRCIPSDAFTPAHSLRRIRSGAFVPAHSHRCCLRPVAIQLQSRYESSSSQSYINTLRTLLIYQVFPVSGI